MRIRLSLAVSLSVLLIVGCTRIDVAGPRPLTMDLTASVAAANVGQTVDFTFEATGALLVEVSVDYGDGVVETVPLAGSQTASGRFDHAWSEAGSYTVVGTVTDSSLGDATSQLTVQISAP